MPEPLTLERIASLRRLCGIWIHAEPKYLVEERLRESLPQLFDAAEAHLKQTAAPAPLLEFAHAAARRLLATEAEVLAMPQRERDWFMGKPGHQDAFDLARFALSLQSPNDAAPARPEGLKGLLREAHAVIHGGTESVSLHRRIEHALVEKAGG